MAKVGRMIAFWDECKLVEQELLYRKDELAEEIKSGEVTEEEIEHQIWQSSSFFDIEWDFLMECLTEIMRKKNPGGYWKVEVRNFGWRGLDGYKYFYAKDGRELICQVLPDCENTFYVYNYGKGLAIQNYHHDNPTGSEWYYITPVAESTYRKHAA